MRAIRERHSLKHGGEQNVLNVGQVVLIENYCKNRGKWNFGMITKSYKGRDGVVRRVHSDRTKKEKKDETRSESGSKGAQTQ